MEKVINTNYETPMVEVVVLEIEQPILNASGEGGVWG